MSLFDRHRKQALIDAMLKSTGMVPQVLADEVDDTGQHFFVLGLPTGVRYGVTVNQTGFRQYRMSLGIQRGLKDVETLYDQPLEHLQIERLLKDPMHLVGILLEQRSGNRYRLDEE